MASSSDLCTREYKEVYELADNITSMISSLRTGPEAQLHSTAIRRMITIFGMRHDSLLSRLTKLPAKHPLTVKYDRARLLRKVMASILNMPNFGNRDSLLGPDIKPADAMSRIAGLDNSVFEVLSRITRPHAASIIAGLDSSVGELEREIMRDELESLAADKEVRDSTTTMAMAPSRDHAFRLSPAPSTNNKYDRQMLREELKIIFDDAIKSCFNLEDEFFKCNRLEGVRQEKYGDYLCINIFTIWEKIRSKDPQLFHKSRPKKIARELLEYVKKTQKGKGRMVEELSIHDVGYIGIKLSSEWMAERIKKMLKDGIDIWAPLIPVETAVVNVSEPAPGEEMHADEIRSGYIRDMIIHLLDYCGVAVERGYCHMDGMELVKEDLIETQGGLIRSRTNKESPLFAVTGEASENAYNKICHDLGTLWSAIYQQGGELIVYVSHVRQRRYVKKCYTAATTNGIWFQGERWPALFCCGYRTATSEKEKLTSLWNEFQTHPKAAFLVDLGHAAGYSVEASFECALKHTYLKMHRLAECMFDMDEMLQSEGNNFFFLLRTRDLILSLIAKVKVGRSDMVKSKNAVFGVERELALHLIQFTDAIKAACLKFLLHPVCKYVCNLCKKFMSYHDQVRPWAPDLILCEATKVVLEKCFHLLGITPEFSRLTSRVTMSSIIRGISDAKEKTAFEVIPFPVSDDARPKNLNSRIELMSMTILVGHELKEGDVFGNISLIDKDGSLSDDRLPIDKNDHGHVTFFYHYWDDAVGIGNGSCVSFGNPSPPCSVPLLSDTEVHVQLFATTKEKDKCYQICDYKGNLPLEVSEFLAKKLSYQRRRLSFTSKDGCTHTLIDCILLRDAVDAAMELTFKSPNRDLGARVSGRIYAYYRGVLDNLDDLAQQRYKTIVFRADRSVLTVGKQQLKKSVLAVPANGYLVIEAFFRDDDSGITILDIKENLRARPRGDINFSMPGKNFQFHLKVEWSKGPRSFYTKVENGRDK